MADAVEMAGSELDGDAPVVGFPVVRVGAVQATPEILDAEASIEKAAGLLERCAEQDVQLAVLPEAFVSLYPSNAWAQRGLLVLWLG